MTQAQDNITRITLGNGYSAEIRPAFSADENESWICAEMDVIGADGAVAGSLYVDHDDNNIPLAETIRHWDSTPRLLFDAGALNPALMDDEGESLTPAEGESWREWLTRIGFWRNPDATPLRPDVEEAIMLELGEAERLYNIEVSERDAESELEDYDDETAFLWWSDRGFANDGELLAFGSRGEAEAWLAEREEQYGLQSSAWAHYDRGEALDYLARCARQDYNNGAPSVGSAEIRDMRAAC